MVLGYAMVSELYVESRLDEYDRHHVYDQSYSVDNAGRVCRCVDGTEVNEKN
jgi:hypothetical protein